MTAFSDETGRDWLPLKYEDGPDFCTVTFATGAAFALTVHPERMKLMEAALSASPVAQEPVAYMWDELIDPTGDVIVGKTVTRFATHWSTPPANAVVTKLYPSPPATPAGLGADEIARVFARWKNSKNLHESLAAQNIEKELLALLSRAGDQGNSTHEA